MFYSVFSRLKLTKFLFAQSAKMILLLFRIFKRIARIINVRLANIISSRLANMRNEGMISLQFVGSNPKLSRQYLVNKNKSVFVGA